MAKDGRPAFHPPEDSKPIVFKADGTPAVSVGRDQSGAYRAQFIRLDVLNSTMLFGPNSALRVADALRAEALKFVDELGFTTSDAVH